MRTYALTTAQVKACAKLLQNPCPHCGEERSVKVVAKKFHISTSTASRIKAGIITSGWDTALENL